jgi:hypothetical protein
MSRRQWRLSRVARPRRSVFPGLCEAAVRCPLELLGRSEVRSKSAAPSEVPSPSPHKGLPTRFSTGQAWPVDFRAKFPLRAIKGPTGVERSPTLSREPGPAPGYAYSVCSPSGPSRFAPEGRATPPRAPFPVRDPVPVTISLPAAPNQRPTPINRGVEESGNVVRQRTNCPAHRPLLAT